MKVPNVHYNTEKKTYSLEKEDCPKSCQQQRICLRIRQTQQLIQDLLNKIGEKYPIFKDPTLIIVGSLKEGTKIGFVDESDVALLLNKKYDKGYFEFDEKQQVIKLAKKEIWKWSERYKRSDLPEELAFFISKDDTFNCTKYFQVFIEELKKVIEEESINYPVGLSMSVKVTPCDVCRSDEDVIPQYIRCKHIPGCEEHKKTTDDPKYKEKCNCDVYNEPSLTFSKIGVVLHLVYREEDKSIKPFIIDVDVNPPTIPVTNVKLFNGSNKMKRMWLKKNKHRITNWRSEWRKSHDMSAAGSVVMKDEKGRVVRENYHKQLDYYYGDVVLIGTRSVRLRMVNRNLVIPEQVNDIAEEFQ